MSTDEVIYLSSTDIYTRCQNAGWTITEPIQPGITTRIDLRNILRAQDMSCDSPAWVTLQLLLDLKGSAGYEAVVGEGFVTLEAIADINWGHKNGKFSAEVDWRTGTMVHLPATYVDIRPVILSEPAAINWTQVMFSAAICPATVPQSKPTRSFGVITLAAAEVLTLTIPNWTTEIAAFPTALAGTPAPLTAVEVRQLGGSGSGLPYDIRQLDAYECCGHCVHGHARFLRLTNQSGEDISFSLMAFLGL